MRAASGLAAGGEATPQLAEAAVRMALERAGLQRANGVVLLLSQEFARLAAPSALAAARAAGCLQVVGATAPGVFTEGGWILDRPAAAALVLGGDLALVPRGEGTAFCFADSAAPLGGWQHAPARFGLLRSGGAAWQQGRLVSDGRAEAIVAGASCRLVISPGLKPLGPPQTITAIRGFDVQRLGESSVAEALLRILPPEWRDRKPLPVHLLAGLPEGCTSAPGIPLLSANADGSITLAQPLSPGQTLGWAARQPLAAEAEMRELLTKTAAELAAPPAFGIQFSCIGRGPLFFDGEDRDLVVWRECFPEIPLIGAYGTGQLAPVGSENRQWQNTVVTALFQENHV